MVSRGVDLVEQRGDAPLPLIRAVPDGHLVLRDPSGPNMCQAFANRARFMLLECG